MGYKKAPETGDYFYIYYVVFNKDLLFYSLEISILIQEKIRSLKCLLIKSVRDDLTMYNFYNEIALANEGVAS
jgi:hypothetical protein